MINDKIQVESLTNNNVKDDSDLERTIYYYYY